MPGIETTGEVVGVGDCDEERWLGTHILGPTRLPNGGFGEYAIVRAAEAFEIPEQLAREEAAALFIGYQTAWLALHRRAHVRAGETVVIHAAAGGFGSAFIEVAPATGANVIAVVRGSSKAEYVRTMGASAVVDRLAEDVQQTVLRRCENWQEVVSMVVLLLSSDELVSVAGEHYDWVRSDCVGSATLVPCSILRLVA
ncbi:zinc-binding dehydrogenase [Saccharopolyspora pogona]|uniref:zinc-binding dehydrogenase n=1 Tax=Saccharopolyspora pogona TaxID=333966 RepID=UPI0016871A9E|nr:zinc-binding dehydrogenase [Saccharopolyspora pogona]